MHDGRWNDGWSGGSAWWMALMMVAVVVLIGGAIVLLARRGRAPSQRSEFGPIANQSSAQAILAERLARGEIEPEEYNTRLAVLLAAPRS